MSTYYNEFDPFAAAWLRELMKAGHIPDGEVDERDMREVDPNEIRGFTQYHFFAGIGGWAYAGRLAGIPDTHPLFTGSPPCQPFSTAGKQEGKDDDRHLAPHWLELVAALRPPFLAGEQVAAAVKKDAWLDDLLDELENQGYATGALVVPACSVGAPHIRQRIFFVGRLGDGQYTGLEGLSGNGYRGNEPGRFDAEPGGPVAQTITVGGMADTCGAASERDTRGFLGAQAQVGGKDGAQYGDMRIGYSDDGAACGMADTKNPDRRGGISDAQAGVGQDGERWRGFAGGSAACGMADACDGQFQESQRGPERRNGPTTTYAEAGPTSPITPGWHDPDWLLCRDGKWRPVESGTFPLANGISNRVGRLRGYGNAIVPQVAAEVLKELMR